MTLPGGVIVPVLGVPDSLPGRGTQGESVHFVAMRFWFQVQ